jgi:catechol 2,3-dioxygenase-like lactoylglutathione lyase family enzyme
MSWAKKLFANTLFVTNVGNSKDFYSRVFEMSPIFEDENSVVFKFGEVLINLLSADEAPGLIAPTKVARREDGSVFQLTIKVDEVDLRVAKLHELGVALINGPLDRPWGMRTALFADPDGHLWEIAQEK